MWEPLCLVVTVEPELPEVLPAEPLEPALLLLPVQPRPSELPDELRRHLPLPSRWQLQLPPWPERAQLRRLLPSWPQLVRDPHEVREARPVRDLLLKPQDQLLLAVQSPEEPTLEPPERPPEQVPALVPVLAHQLKELLERREPVSQRQVCLLLAEVPEQRVEELSRELWFAVDQCPPLWRFLQLLVPCVDEQ